MGFDRVVATLAGVRVGWMDWGRGEEGTGAPGVNDGEGERGLWDAAVAVRLPVMCIGWGGVQWVSPIGIGMIL